MPSPRQQLLVWPLCALGLTLTACFESGNSERDDVFDEWEYSEPDEWEYSEPDEWDPWDEWEYSEPDEWDSWDEWGPDENYEWCEETSGECYYDSDCGPGYSCSYGEFCQPSYCCYNEWGETSCSDDCVPQCIPEEEADADRDGLIDKMDNCPLVYNPEQTDSNGDGIGDACQEECYELFNECHSDADCSEGSYCGTFEEQGWCEPEFCCWDPNFEREYCSGCAHYCIPFEDIDTDFDGIPDLFDNCLETPNPDQTDSDNDGLGDACDPETCTQYMGCSNNSQCGAAQVCDPGACQPSICCTDQGGNNTNCSDDCLPACAPGPDADSDGVTDTKDNCPLNSNAAQDDFDFDGLGDACDLISCIYNRRCINDDSCLDNQICDLAACVPSTCCLSNGNLQCTSDCNSTCTLGPDGDSDGVTDSKDNCPQVYNADQADSDGNGVGDACQ